MSCNFLLLTTTIILSMVTPSRNAISFPQIPTLELIRPDYNVTANSDVFPHNAIPHQSSPPIGLPPNLLFCKARTISDDTRNMSSVRGAAAGSSLDIAHVTSPAWSEVLILGLNIFSWRIVLLIPFFGAPAALWKMYCAEYEMQQRRRARDAFESGAQTNIRARASRAIWEKVVWTGKGKGPYIKQMAMTYIEESECILCKSNSAHKVPSICYLLNEAFDELEKHPEIYEDPKLYDFATIFLMIEVNRILFMNAPIDKKVWLKERYILK